MTLEEAIEALEAACFCGLDDQECAFYREAATRVLEAIEEAADSLALARRVIQRNEAKIVHSYF